MPQDYDQWKDIVTRPICQRLPRGGNEDCLLLDGYKVLIWEWKGSCGLNNNVNVLNDIELNITTKVDGIRVKRAKFTKDS